MKYLKIYENKNDELWIVTQISTIGPDDYSLVIFDDKESAENYFVYLVNYHVKNDIHSDDEEDIDYVFTVEDAKKIKGQLSYSIEYNKYINEGKYELPESLKIGRDAKKYNL
jgi:hypothetical protein